MAFLFAYIHFEHAHKLNCISTCLDLTAFSVVSLLLIGSRLEVWFSGRTVSCQLVVWRLWCKLHSAVRLKFSCILVAPVQSPSNYSWNWVLSVVCPFRTNKWRCDLPRYVTDSRGNLPWYTTDCRCDLLRYATDSRCNLPQYVTDSRCDFPRYATDSRCNLPWYTTDSRCNLPRYTTDSRCDLPRYITDSRCNM